MPPWSSSGRAEIGAADLAHLYVYADGEGILLEQKPEPQCWDTIRSDWTRFMQFVTDDLPPPPTERDTVVRMDEAWQIARTRIWH